MNGCDTRSDAVCLTDSEPDLQMGKVYRVLPDAAAAQDGYVRVIDDSGEDYLYPREHFTPVKTEPPEDTTA